LAGRKFGEFGESSMIRQTKTIQISTYNYNLLAESIHSANFFCQMFKMSKFTKFLPCQTFPLYGINSCSDLSSFAFIFNSTSKDDCNELQETTMAKHLYLIVKQYT